MTIQLIGCGQLGKVRYSIYYLRGLAPPNGLRGWTSEAPWAVTTGVPGIVASITIKFIRLQLKHQEYDDQSWLAHVVIMKV